jgi:hypothetical protein
VEISEGVDEIASLEPAHLRDKVGEERVARDVERHAEEDVGAALVELAAQLAVRDVELEQGVAGRQGHFVDLARVPCRDDEAAAVGVFPDLPDDVVELVDGAAVGGSPVAPLGAIDAAEIARLGIGPFVPDRDAPLLEPADVCFAADEPEELVDDALEVDLLGREQGKAFAQREAELSAEDGKRSGPGAVGFGPSVFENVAEEVEVGLHAARRGSFGRGRGKINERAARGAFFF